MKKVLMLAAVPSMIGQFNMENIRLLLAMGYEVHVACNFYDTSVWTKEKISEFISRMKALKVHCHQIGFSRSPGEVKRLFQSFRQMDSLVKKEGFQFVHCHTPVAAAVGRVVCHRNHVKVIYTAHGFHFYSGAPLKNWLLYYPVEWLCSWWTDVLITINREDYSRAKKRFHAGQVCYIPGVGVDTSHFKIKPEYQKENGKKELGVPEDALLLVSVGELNLNKNHQVVIRAIAKLNDEKIHYVIAGKGSEYGNLKNLSEELGITSQIHLLGYRNDIEKIYAASDICVFPSIREGLGLAAIEGMAAGLPLIVSDNRGAHDFAVNMKNALVCNPQSVSEFVNAIVALKDRNMRAKFGERNLIISEKFGMEKTNKKMKRIYFQTENDHIK